MATVVSIDGLGASTYSVSNLGMIDAADWEIVDTEILSYDSGDGQPILHGSRTLFRELNSSVDPVTVRIEVNPGRDADGVPKYNCSIRWNGYVKTTVDSVETINDPFTSVLAWTSLRTPVFGGDSSATHLALANLFSFVSPSIVTGAIYEEEVLDRLAVSLTSIDMSAVTRT